jgi:hypothetical protein
MSGNETSHPRARREATFHIPDRSDNGPSEDSFLAETLSLAETDARARAERGDWPDEPWTLGATAHLLWITSPASRPHLMRLVSERFQRAFYSEKAPTGLFAFEILNGIYVDEVLEPLMSALPESRNVLNEELSFLRAAATYRGRHMRTIRHEIDYYLLENLRRPALLDAIASVDEALANFVRSPDWPHDVVPSCPTTS